MRPARQQQRSSTATSLDSQDRRAIFALCLITAVITFFWAAYEQSGNAVVLWVRDSTDRSFFGLFDLKITWFQSLNPLFIFSLTPLLVLLWARQARRGAEPGLVTKLAIGCFLAALAFGLLTIAALIAGPGGRASWIWTVAFFLLLTFAELHVSPVALSLFSRVAPVRVASMMMGVWFMSGVLGNYLAGLLGSFWESLSKPTFWMVAAFVAAAAGGVVLLVQQPVAAVIKAQDERRGRELSC